MNTSILGRIITIILMTAFLASCGSDDDSSPTDPGGSGGSGQQADGFSGSLPNGVGCDFFADAQTRGPGGAGLLDGEADYGRIAEGGPSLDGHIEGVNSNCEGYGFPYEGIAHTELSAGSIYSRTMAVAEGNGTNRVDDYESWGMVSFEIYFTATSSDPATTGIDISVPFSLSSHLSFGFDSDDDTDYVDVYAKSSLSAKVFETGTWEGEMGPEFGLTDMIAENVGSVRIGFESGRLLAVSSGFMEECVSVGVQEADVAESTSLSFHVAPSEIMCLRYETMTKSDIAFHGMYNYPASADAHCSATAIISRPVSGTDPDHPDAEISIVIHSVEY